MGAYLQSYIPKRTLDKIMFVYMLLLVHNVVFYLYFIVFPWRKERYETSDLKIYLYKAWILFLYVNIIGGTWKVISVNTTTRGVILPTVLKPGWLYCDRCQANSPPRSYHCQFCDICVLKRDHHCIYTGRCIGYHNYRYYLTLLGSCILLAVFTSCASLSLAWDMLGEFSIYHLAGYIFPLIMFLFGIFDFYKTYVILLSFVCTLFSLMLSGLAIWHIKHVLHNMTAHERRRGAQMYDIGIQENLRQIFGRNWRVSWMCPFIPSPLPGDGVEFPTKDNYECPKDL